MSMCLTMEQMLNQLISRGKNNNGKKKKKKSLMSETFDESGKNNFVIECQ